MALCRRRNFGKCYLFLIGNFAFTECAQLEEVEIAKLPSRVCYRVFGGCTNLKKIRLAYQIGYKDGDGDLGLFDGCSIEDAIIPSYLESKVDELFGEYIPSSLSLICEDGSIRPAVRNEKHDETCEDILLGRELRNSPSNENESLLMDAAVSMSQEILNGMEIVGVEQIVFDERLGIAGTIDLLARSKKDGILWILDHKTNRSIDTENSFGNFALPPIQHVPDLNYYHYSLQLNLYDRLLHEAGYCPKDEKIKKAILHIQPNGHKTYVLKDMSEEIDRLLAAGANPDQR